MVVAGLEQHSQLPSIEIHGVPNVNRKDLMDFLRGLSTKLNLVEPSVRDIEAVSEGKRGDRQQSV